MLGILRTFAFGNRRRATKIKAALKVETIKRARLSQETGDVRRAEYAIIRSDHQQRGILESGPHFAALHHCELKHLEALIKGIVNLRRESLAIAPELGEDACYDALRNDLERTIERVIKNIPEGIRASGLRYFESPNTPKDDIEVIGLKALARNEIEILRNSFVVELFNAHSSDAKKGNRIAVVGIVIALVSGAAFTWWQISESRSQAAKSSPLQTETRQDSKVQSSPNATVIQSGRDTIINNPPPKVEVKPEPKTESKPAGQANLTPVPKSNAVHTMVNSPGGIQALGNVTVSSDRRLIHSLVLKVVMELETAELPVTQPGEPTMNLAFGPALGVFTKSKMLYRFASEGQFKSEQIAPTVRRYTFSYKPESEEQLLGKPIEVLAEIEQLGINARSFLEMVSSSPSPANTQPPSSQTSR